MMDSENDAGKETGDNQRFAVVRCSFLVVAMSGFEQAG